MNEESLAVQAAKALLDAQAAVSRLKEANEAAYKAGFSHRQIRNAYVKLKKEQS